MELKKKRFAILQKERKMACICGGCDEKKMLFSEQLTISTAK